MTPFGAKLREIRAERGVTLKQMATALGVSAAYLSALEHGRRGPPPFPFVQQVIAYLGVIWEEAEALECLARLSHPRVHVDTAGLAPEATLFANRLAETIGDLDGETLDALNGILDTRR